MGLISSKRSRANRSGRLYAWAASEDLAAIVADAVHDAAVSKHSDSPTRRIDLIIAPAGIGKTSCVVKSLAAEGAALAAAGRPPLRTVALAPDLTLATQINDRARSHDIDSHLILGMAQFGPDGKQGCEFFDDARDLAAAGYSVAKLMCQSKDAVCPHLGSCRQSRNLTLVGSQLLCAASDFLNLQHGVIDPETADLLVADENTLPKMLTYRRHVDARLFDREIRKGYGGRKVSTGDMIDHRIAVMAVAAALRCEDDQGNPIVDQLAWLREKASSDTLRAAAVAKFADAEEDPGIRPGMNPQARSKIIAALSARQRESRGAAHILMTAAAEVDSGRTGPFYGLSYDAETEQITVHRLAPDRFAANRRIAIDATMEPEVVRYVLNPPASSFQPKDRPSEDDRAAHDSLIRVHRIDAAMSGHVKIRQITDTLISRKSLMGDAAASRRADMKTYIEDVCETHRKEIEANSKRRVLVCTYQFVEERWITEGFHRPNDDDRLFDVLHFGKLRGNDDYADCAALILIGRNETGVDAVESMAKAVWYADSTPLTFLPPTENEHGRQAWPTRKDTIRRKDGGMVEVEVSTHPDSRVDALRRIIAAETMQAMARCRPYFRSSTNSCAVHILTCIPLAGVEVDETFSWISWTGDWSILPTMPRRPWPALWPIGGGTSKRPRPARMARN